MFDRFEMTNLLRIECKQMRTGLQGMYSTDAEWLYQVWALDHTPRRAWEFVVTGVRGKSIHVEPQSVPLKRFENLIGEKLVFKRIRRATRQCYCEIRMANRNDRCLRQSDRSALLPKVKKLFRRSVRPKSDVVSATGLDGESLVFTVESSDHARMIEFFFATRIWSLMEQANG